MAIGINAYYCAKSTAWNVYGLGCETARLIVKDQDILQVEALIVFEKVDVSLGFIISAKIVFVLKGHC